MIFLTEREPSELELAQKELNKYYSENMTLGKSLHFIAQCAWIDEGRRQITINVDSFALWPDMETANILQRFVEMVRESQAKRPWKPTADGKGLVQRLNLEVNP
jgi:hypothetical protein